MKTRAIAGWIVSTLLSGAAFALEEVPSPAVTEAAAPTASEPAKESPAPPPPPALLAEKEKTQGENSEGAPLPAAPVKAVVQDKGIVPAAEPLPASSAAELEKGVVAQTAPAAAPVAMPKAKKSPAPLRIAKHKKKGGKRVAKKAKGSRSRMPASVEDEAVQVFDEGTSFETLVRERKKVERDPAAFAPSARIIAVRRELGLTSSDAAAAPQDIVLNAGTENGLDEGMVLSVARSIPILDPYKENQQKQLEVEFARIRIVHAQPNLAIARLERLTPIKTGLAVGTRAVLIGDYVGQFTK